MPLSSSFFNSNNLIHSHRLRHSRVITRKVKALSKLQTTKVKLSIENKHPRTNQTLSRTIRISGAQTKPKNSSIDQTLRKQTIGKNILRATKETKRSPKSRRNTALTSLGCTRGDHLSRLHHPKSNHTCTHPASWNPKMHPASHTLQTPFGP
jgi:hypothetical protein